MGLIRGSSPQYCGDRESTSRAYVRFLLFSLFFSIKKIVIWSMYFIYILYSISADKFYIGYSSDPFRRLVEHNTKPFDTFTSKYCSWKMASVFKCSEIKSESMRIERFIKKQKSRKLLKQLCNPSFISTGSLFHLVRVTYVQD